MVFDAGIANDNNCKSFVKKTKLLWKMVGEGMNEILRNATTAAPLKCSRKFWRSLELPLIYFKVELNLKWTKCYVLSGTGVDNVNGNRNSIVFTIKNTKLYVPAVSLSAEDNQKLWKNFSYGIWKISLLEWIFNKNCQ